MSRGWNPYRRREIRPGFCANKPKRKVAHTEACHCIFLRVAPKIAAKTNVFDVPGEILYEVYAIFLKI